MRQTLISLPVLALLAAASIDAIAQSVVGKDGYPNRPIRMIIPVAPGGSTDIVGRIVSSKLSAGLGHQVVVENRPGASGMIGSEVVAKSAPDGYTLLFAYASHTTTPFLFAKVPYDTLKAFAPVSLVATQPLVLVVSSSLRVDSVKSLIDLARSRPGQLNAGVVTVGSGGHLATETFKKASGTDILSVIYQGGGPSQLALLSGEVHMAFATTALVLPQLKSGRIKALATTRRQRLSYLADVPTLAETGLKDVDVVPWQGILAPAGTPPSVIERLHSEVVKLLKAPDTLERLAATGSDPVGSTPAEFGAWIKRELTLFGQVVTTESGASRA